MCKTRQILEQILAEDSKVQPGQAKDLGPDVDDLGLLGRSPNQSKRVNALTDDVEDTAVQKNGFRT